jgi:predicted nucleic acid-binding protein
MKGDPTAEEMVRIHNPLKTTAISSADFLFGARNSGKKKMYDISEKFIRFFPVLPFDADSAVIYANLASALSGTGRRISTLDELIAAMPFAMTNRWSRGTGIFRD